MSGAITPGVSTFDYAGWIARYPEFAAVSPILAGQYFAEAGLYLPNTVWSPLADSVSRTVILLMITSHIASLAQRDLVGRLDNASEGSVSVHAEMQPAVNSSAWWMSTKYGVAAWNATASLRTAQYVPGPGAPCRFPNAPGAFMWRT